MGPQPASSRPSSGIALLIWLSEILGTFNLFYAWSLVGAAVALAVGIALASVRGGRPGGPDRVLGFSPGGSSLSPSGPGEKQDAAPDQAPPASFSGPTIFAIAVVALVFAHWGLTTKDALDRGIFNFDSLWYHMPFAVDMVQSHSVTGLHYTDTVFTNWFYPQNSELLHAAGILLTAARHAVAVLELGLPWARVPGCLVRGPALWARAPQRGRRRDPARVPHAGRARAWGGQERSRRGGSLTCCCCDPRQRLG